MTDSFNHTNPCGRAAPVQNLPRAQPFDTAVCSALNSDSKYTFATIIALRAARTSPSHAATASFVAASSCSASDYRDRIYGSVVTRRLRAMGIRDKPTARASPWLNGFAERLIGSIRRECVGVSKLGSARMCG
jgi:hypothetical protein